MSLFVFDTTGNTNLLKKDNTIIKKNSKKSNNLSKKLKNNFSKKPKNDFSKNSKNNFTKNSKNNFTKKSKSDFSKKSKNNSGGKGPLPQKSLPEPIDPGSEEEDDGDYGGLPPPSHDISHIIKKFIEKEPNEKIEDDMEYAINTVNSAEEAKANRKSDKKYNYKNRPNKNLDFPEFDRNTGLVSDSLSETNVDEVIKQSNINGIEREKSIPSLSDKTIRDLRKIEASKTKGEGWFNMQATEKTEEVENDLKILQMRSVLNPKQFYKKNDLKVLPKYFQIGTVQHSPLDYYNERDTRRNKKKTLVDELLADAEFQKFTKRKFKEVTARNDKYLHRKNMKKMKKLKKNK